MISEGRQFSKVGHSFEIGYLSISLFDGDCKTLKMLSRVEHHSNLILKPRKVNTKPVAYMRILLFSSVD